VEFENEFTVEAPVDEVYSALLDLERVTPAMPGAQVLERIDDDHYKVAIKVKLGPVTMTYRGDVTVVEKDPSAHRAVLDVKAKEARGQGSANATVTMALEPQGSATRGTMRAEVQLSGKAAAMSRGVIDDVSKRLVTTFAGNLEGILGSEASTAAGEGEADEGSPAGSAAAGSGEAEAGSNGGATPGSAAEAAQKPSPPAAEALDVGPLAAGMAADRLKDPKVLGAVLGGTLLLGYLLGRRS
jgi:carbon monoxide dehydrogenase subunit G